MSTLTSVRWTPDVASVAVTVTVAPDTVAVLAGATLSTETKIYLDRSAAKKSGTLGSRSDCQKGRRGEVKFVYEGETRTARVEWIKIQAP